MDTKTEEKKAAPEQKTQASTDEKRGAIQASTQEQKEGTIEEKRARAFDTLAGYCRKAGYTHVCVYEQFIPANWDNYRADTIPTEDLDWYGNYISMHIEPLDARVLKCWFANDQVDRVCLSFMKEHRLDYTVVVSTAFNTLRISTRGSRNGSRDAPFPFSDEIEIAIRGCALITEALLRERREAGKHQGTEREERISEAARAFAGL